MELGFIGLGHIGGAMAANLAKDGHALSVFDLDGARAARLAAAGAKAASGPAQVARDSEITFLSLPTPDVVDAVAKEWLEGARPDAVLVDLSTNAPARVRALAERVRAAGRHLLDAPLSGGAPGAQGRMLMFMVGGEPATFERVRPLLARLGRATFHVGPAGAGSVAKLVNSLVAFSGTLSTLEALALAVAAGLDLRQMVTVLRTGGAGNFYTNMAVEGIGRRASEPQFALDLAAKDAGLVVELERSLGQPGRFAASIAALLGEACAGGMGQSDWTQLPAFFEKEARLAFRLAPDATPAAPTAAGGAPAEARPAGAATPAAYDPLARGIDVARKLWGDRAGGQELPAQKLAPDFFRWVMESVFGGLWSRQGLALRDRSLCTVAQLAALGRSEELKGHLAGALNLGIRREELVEVLMQTACYAGVPAAVNALNAAAEVLGRDS